MPQESVGHGEKRSRLAEKAIAALLFSPTLAAAASQAGISEKTLGRWLKDRKFRERYRHARRCLLDNALGLLAAGAAEAVAKLRANLSCGDVNAENRAAIALLVNAIGAEVKDQAERLDAIEERVLGGASP